MAEQLTIFRTEIGRFVEPPRDLQVNTVRNELTLVEIRYQTAEAYTRLAMGHITPPGTAKSQRQTAMYSYKAQRTKTAQQFVSVNRFRGFLGVLTIRIWGCIQN